MIEREKKARLVEHLKKIANEGDFVECPHKFVAEYLDSLFAWEILVVHTFH